MREGLEKGILYKESCESFFELLYSCPGEEMERIHIDRVYKFCSRNLVNVFSISQSEICESCSPFEPPGSKSDADEQ
jgi:hypothetical protein